MSDVPYGTGASSRVNLVRTALLGLNVALWVVLALLVRVLA
jgi:hypothetical protein